MTGPALTLKVVDDYEELSRAAAEAIRNGILARPDAAIVAATGNTPMGAYAQLACLGSGDPFAVDQVRLFQLDEYLGIGTDDRRSLYGWMKRGLMDPLGIREEQVTRLRGDAADPSAACREYDRAVADAGGFDLAILGLGPNGHLGFNEPPALPDTPTRVVELAPESIASNAAYWGDLSDVPRRALTAGMALLLAARHILVLVAGEHKREILARALQRPESPAVPASYLRRGARVTVIADRAAVSPALAAAMLLGM